MTKPQKDENKANQRLYFVAPQNYNVFGEHFGLTEFWTET